MNGVNRREFVGMAAVAGGLAAVRPAQAQRANETLRGASAGAIAEGFRTALS